MIRKICLILYLYASLSACKKSDPGIPDDSSFFGRFNGFAASVTTMNPPGDGLANLTVNSSPDTSGNFSNWSYTSSLVSKQGFGISISKGYLLNAGITPPAAGMFQAFFSAGSVPYITLTNPANGIVVSYVDTKGVLWNSAIGDQSTGTFTITKSEVFGANMKVQAEFSCKLYDGNGNTLTLTGGMFTGQFKPI